MLEILKYIFSSFWIWFGFLILLCCFIGLTAAIAGIVAEATKYLTINVVSILSAGRSKNTKE